MYCLGIRMRAGRLRGDDPLAILRYAASLGAGGIQVPLGVREPAYARKLRDEAERGGMFVEGICSLPQGPADVDRFEAQLRTAKAAGAAVVRVVIIPGRRYERFGSAEEFRTYAERGRAALERAEPAAARTRIRLAVENHKDQRVPERLALLERISSRYVGACVDMGNSFALLEDPLAVVEAYAPWAFSVHAKDQAVGEYEDGFLFADVPLGRGFLDLRAMVRALRAARPEARYSLEVITRDPLKVPYLTAKYWATFGDVPARDLARTLRTVKAHARADLPRVSHLPLADQVKREELNVTQSLAYAREHLGL
jgi:sugar phosphate isomerase/epimerase